MANLRRINQEDLRNHNLSVTLDTLLRAQKPMSRADLAKETGLTSALRRSADWKRWKGDCMGVCWPPGMAVRSVPANVGMDS